MIKSLKMCYPLNTLSIDKPCYDIQIIIYYLIFHDAKMFTLEISKLDVLMRYQIFFIITIRRICNCCCHNAGCNNSRNVNKTNLALTLNGCLVLDLNMHYH